MSDKIPVSKYGIKNPFKVGGWYGMEEDGYSFLAKKCGVFIPDKTASKWMFEEKLRRMGEFNE